MSNAHLSHVHTHTERGGGKRARECQPERKPDIPYIMETCGTNITIHMVQVLKAWIYHITIQIEETSVRGRLLRLEEGRILPIILHTAFLNIKEIMYDM